MEKTIAVIDDEKDLRETVQAALIKEGYHVNTYKNGKDALEAFKHSMPDLILLDILMPGIDGLEVCRKIHKDHPEQPVIFVTSKDEEIDLILGLEIGADDYITKPFSLRELISRIKVIFRRMSYTYSPSANLLHYKKLQLDNDSMTAYWNSTRIYFSVTEFRVLACLLQNPGIVKTREQLLSYCYNQDVFASSRTIDNHIKRIRQKLTTADPSLDVIETIYGMGYRFNEEN